MNLNVATVLFTYKRYEHTKKTLDALSQNTILPKILYIFQDGIKSEGDIEEWEKVNLLIKQVNWCKTKIFVSSHNKGLAESITCGIDKVLNKEDAVIVLEDDCVPHPLFMEYATSCLMKYKDNDKVFSINGYSWPVEVSPNGTDAYFAGRAGSWGWATWKNRWQLYQVDYRILVEIKKSEKLRKQYNVWGQDLESHLLGNIEGRYNSWAVFWSLQCIKQSGLCPTPYKSLIENIGTDGTGEHCGNVKLVSNTRKWNDCSHIELPDNILLPVNYETAYSDRFRWIQEDKRLKIYNDIFIKWIKLLQKGISINKYFEEKKLQKIAIWGKGNLCELLINEISEKLSVEAIVESNPTIKECMGISIVGIEEIQSNIDSIVVIPVYDMERIKQKVKMELKDKLVGIDEIIKYVMEK